MWIYVAYRWPSESDYLTALSEIGWANGSPPNVDLLPSGVLYLPPNEEGQPSDPILGWHVAAAFSDIQPPLEWAEMEIVPPDFMPVIGRMAVPNKVTNFQARAVLMQTPSGVEGVSLFRVIDDALRGGKGLSQQGDLAWQAWEQANDFYRNGALVNNLGSQFGLTASQIDNLFRAASKIDA